PRVGARAVDHPAGARPLTAPAAPEPGLAAAARPDAAAIPHRLYRHSIPHRVVSVLFVVRHVDSELIVQGRFQGQAESPLSATGRRQAELVARRLARPLGTPALPLPDGPPRA